MVDIILKIKVSTIIKRSYKQPRKRCIKKIENIKDYKDFIFS